MSNNIERSLPEEAYSLNILNKKNDSPDFVSKAFAEDLRKYKLRKETEGKITPLTPARRTLFLKTT